MAKRTSIKLTKKICDKLTSDDPGGTRTYDSELRGFGVHTFPSGRKNYFLDYTSPVTRRRRRMKIASYGEGPLGKARDKAKDRLGEIRKGIDPLEERRREREGSTFEQWAETYKEIRRKDGKWKPRTTVEAHRHLKRACEAFGRVHLAALDAKTLTSWRDSLNTKYGLATANRSLATIKGCLSQAWSDEIVESNVGAKVQPITGAKPRTRTLSDKEIEALREAVYAHHDPHFRVAMLWLMATGARRSEVLRATWSDLQLGDHARWTIPDPKNDDPMVRPIPPDLVAEIARLPRSDVRVVGHRWKHVRTFHTWWIKLRAAAGLPDDIHMHDLRRTVGLLAVREGGLQVAQRLLGHKNIATTARVYTPLTTDDLREHQDAVVARILPFRKQAEGGQDE